MLPECKWIRACLAKCSPEILNVFPWDPDWSWYLVHIFSLVFGQSIGTGIPGFSIESLSKLAVICWCIWRAGNYRVFQKSPPTASSVAVQAESQWMEMSRVLCPDCSSSVSSSRASSPSISWTPHPSNSVKIDCDASWKASYQMGFAGIVVCSHTSMLLDGRRVDISAPSALLCEALALHEVRSMAKSLQFSDIQTSTSHCVSLSLLHHGNVGWLYKIPDLLHLSFVSRLSLFHFTQFQLL